MVALLLFPLEAMLSCCYCLVYITEHSSLDKTGQSRRWRILLSCLVYNKQFREVRNMQTGVTWAFTYVRNGVTPDVGVLSLANSVYATHFILRSISHVRRDLLHLTVKVNTRHPASLDTRGVLPHKTYTGMCRPTRS